MGRATELVAEELANPGASARRFRVEPPSGGGGAFKEARAPSDTSALPTEQARAVAKAIQSHRRAVAILIGCLEGSVPTRRFRAHAARLARGSGREFHRGLTGDQSAFTAFLGLTWRSTSGTLRLMAEVLGDSDLAAKADTLTALVPDSPSATAIHELEAALPLQREVLLAVAQLVDRAEQ
jgi:hypothetical protein